MHCLYCNPAKETKQSKLIMYRHLSRIVLFCLSLGLLYIICICIYTSIYICCIFIYIYLCIYIYTYLYIYILAVVCVSFWTQRGCFLAPRFAHRIGWSRFGKVDFGTHARRFTPDTFYYADIDMEDPP